MIRRLAATAAVFLALSAPAALAHPKLVSTTPKAGSTVTAPSKIVLTFSETLQPQFTGATLSSHMTTGGAAHDMDVGGITAAVDAKNPKSLVVTSKAPLKPGIYKVSWHAVATDTHRVTGTLNFTVK